jgi:predicted nucleotide-binding protein (sugar kinase/HSP70/actin superfamily)
MAVKDVTKKARPRRAANRIAAVIEEYLETLPAAVRSKRLKEFHHSVNESFAVSSAPAKRSKTGVPVSVPAARRG